MTDEQPNNPAPADTVPPSKGSILFVDDDKFLVEMYGLKFHSVGYTVHTALSADEGLAVLREGFAADAVLFDIAMGAKDGFAFLAALNKEGLARDALWVALTNQSDDVERAKAIELGADLYLVKASVIPSEVVNIVEDAFLHKSKA
jgi:two-component system chemotaxis sensor kinase CheA